jgi:hypothetical protein
MPSVNIVRRVTPQDVPALVRKPVLIIHCTPTEDDRKAEELLLQVLNKDQFVVVPWKEENSKDDDVMPRVAWRGLYRGLEGVEAFVEVLNGYTRPSIF